MHGLINRSIQSFVRDTYGHPAWDGIVADTNLGSNCFEALTVYDDQITFDVIDAASSKLGKPRDIFLEDLGTYLCTHQNLEPVRRLLRFGGETFVDFLWSLDDLVDRARLAVPELELPGMELLEHKSGGLTLRCAVGRSGFGHVMVGVLRAMSDDYGTLALLTHMGCDGGDELISIQLLEAEFSKGRAFELSPRAV